MTVSIFRTVAYVYNGISDNASTAMVDLKLPDNGAIIDLKFLDDKSLLVLSRQKGLPSSRNK